ncbi:putative cellobiose dehydrogenase protein [Rosellinia necatrix]|uniref:Putative cellobiose dehydrogenase protein n=1 Tax=Rosellinia necatrix TaxID=77044 RepID=A0A1S7UL76_ROSNE|nr:putative cellobiose dehydrogenase protein [Rosellinia necatrix]
MRLLGIVSGLTALLGASQVHADVKPLPLPTSCSGVSSMRFPGTVASGWSAMKIAGGLRGVRTVAWDTNGNMLVAEAGKGISVHVFGDNGCISSSATLISNVQLNHGLALSPDGRTLYASGERSVWSWAYDPAARAVSGQKTVVAGMDSGIHSTRNLLVVRAQPNLLLVQVGSNANLDMQSAQPATGRAIIKIFDVSKAPAAGFNYKTDGEVFAYGLRNEIGFVQDPAGVVWGVENSGDDFRLNNQDIHQDNPAEKLNNLGDPLTARNNWYGYPTCFTVWSPTPFAGAGLRTGSQFMLAAGNGVASHADCAAKARAPRLTFQAHSAPIWNAFDAAAANMYVTFHGSWDRQPPTGFKVVEVPFTRLASGAYDPVAPADSMTGYRDIFSAPNPAGCTANGLTQSNCIRLTAAAWDPAGRGLFIGSDNAAEGEIYILSKK